MTYEPDPLIRLKTIKEVQANHKVHYKYWLQKAVEQGYSNSRIGRALDVSEAAVRTYRKRNGI